MPQMKDITPLGVFRHYKLRYWVYPVLWRCGQEHELRFWQPPRPPSAYGSPPVLGAAVKLVIGPPASTGLGVGPPSSVVFMSPFSCVWAYCLVGGFDACPHMPGLEGGCSCLLSC